MTILEVLTAPNPILKKIASEVDSVDGQIRKQMDNMLETMYHDKGIGLAAPQVGISNRILVLDITQDKDGEKGKPIFMINPKVIWESEEMNVYNEGCLSVPELYADVERPLSICLTFLDYNGSEQEIEATDLLSTCIQHEIDHLNGVLFIDHLSSLKRNMILRKLKKQEKQDHIL